MSGKISQICTSMEADFHNKALQMKCISEMKSFLCSDCGQSSYVRAFQCIDSSIRSNSSDSDLISSTILLIAAIFQNHQPISLLIPTHFSSLIQLILSSQSIDAQQCEAILSAVITSFSSPKLMSQFQSPQFVRSLTSISRTYHKSIKILSKVSTIAVNLVPALPLQDLAYALSPVCTPDLPEMLIAMSSIADKQTLADIGSALIPALASACKASPKNADLIRSLTAAVAKSPSSVISAELCSVLPTTPMFIDALDRARKEVRLPPEAFFVAETSLLSAPSVVSQALAVIFESLSSANGRISPSKLFFSNLASVLTINCNDKTIVRRALAVVHFLSSNQENDRTLFENGFPAILENSMMHFLDSVRICSTATDSLANLSGGRTEFASQLNPSRIKEIAHTFRNNRHILKNLLRIIRSIALSRLSFLSFVNAEADKKSEYTVGFSDCKELFEKKTIKSALARSLTLLMEPSKEARKAAEGLISSNISDLETVVAGLALGVDDINVVSSAYEAFPDETLRFAYNVFIGTKKKLGRKTIECLLDSDCAVANEIIEAQISLGNHALVANLFEFNSIDKIGIAFSLFKSGMFSPSQDDYELIMKAAFAYESNPKKLFASLQLLSIFGLSYSSLPLLIHSIQVHPTDYPLVSKCISFISSFDVQPDLMDEAISALSSVIISNPENEVLCFISASLLSAFSERPAVSSEFTQILPALSNAAKLSDRIQKLLLKILSNISGDPRLCQIIPRFLPPFDISSDLILLSNLIECGWDLPKEKSGEIQSLLDSHPSLPLLHLALRISAPFTLDSKLFSQLLRVSDECTVSKAAELMSISTITFTDDLCFSIVDALERFYSSESASVSLCTCVAKSQKKNVFSGRPKVFSELIRRHSNSIVVLEASLPYATKDAAIDALRAQRSEKAVTIIADFLRSLGETEFDAEPIIKAVLDFKDSSAVCSGLLPILYFASSQKRNKPIILSSLRPIAETATDHINSNRFSRALMGIFCSLSADAADALGWIGQYVDMICKAWIGDQQINEAICLLIKNFCSAAVAHCLSCLVPDLVCSLKDGLFIKSTCKSIGRMAPFMGKMAKNAAENIIELIPKSEDKITLAKCVVALNQKGEISDIVSQRLDVIFDLAEKEDVEVAKKLLELATLVRGEAMMDAFGERIPVLMRIIQGRRLDVSVKAASCLLNISKQRCEVLGKWGDDILHLGDKSSGELLRICLSIKDNLLKFRHGTKRAEGAPL